MSDVACLLSVLVCVGVTLGLLRARRPSSSADTVATLQSNILQKRWEAIGPNRATYSGQCSSVGDPRPLTKRDS